VDVSEHQGRHLADLDVWRFRRDHRLEIVQFGAVVPARQSGETPCTSVRTRLDVCSDAGRQICQRECAAILPDNPTQWSINYSIPFGRAHFVLLSALSRAGE